MFRPQVLGTAKNAIVVWIGIVFLGETVTVLQGVGYAISLGGFAAYNYLKMQPDAAGACGSWPGSCIVLKFPLVPKSGI